MRFKVDEGLPADVATFLRSANHDADSVDDEGDDRLGDEDIGQDKGAFEVFRNLTAHEPKSRCVEEREPLEPAVCLSSRRGNCG